MAAHLIYTRGLPASGKTTWAKEQVLRRPGTVRANRDDLRLILHEGRFSKGNEKVVTRVQRAMIIDGLLAGQTVIVDDTNLNPGTVQKLIAIAADYGCPVTVQDFTHVPMRECIARDAKRERSVGEDVIRRMWQNHLAPPPRELTGKPRCVLFDVDGTLALMGDRGPYDWAKVGDDKPNPLVVQLSRVIIDQVVVCSGRDGSCRDATKDWLVANGVPFVNLFMRETGDTRPDWQVKAEILHRDVLPQWDPVLAVDDRQQVVDVWRENAIETWQVAPGRF